MEKNTEPRGPWLRDDTVTAWDSTLPPGGENQCGLCDHLSFGVQRTQWWPRSYPCVAIYSLVFLLLLLLSFSVTFDSVTPLTAAR